MRGRGTLSDNGVSLLAESEDYFRFVAGRGDVALMTRGVGRGGHPGRLGADEMEDKETAGGQLGDEDACAAVVAVAVESEAATSEDHVVEIAAAVGVRSARGRFEENLGVVDAGVVDYPLNIPAQERERAGAVGTVVDNPGGAAAQAAVALDGAQELDVGEREATAEGALELKQIFS